MQQNIPETIPALLEYAEMVKIGAAQYGAAIPLLRHPAASIESDIEALIAGVGDFEQGKVQLSTLYKAQNTVVDSGIEFLVLARGLLRAPLGKRYSEAWNAAGWRHTTAVPRTHGAIQTALLELGKFLTGNPQWEVPTRNMTAATAQALYEQLRDARGAVNLQEKAVSDLIRARDAKASLLTKRIRGVIRELTDALPPLDSRWLGFGLNMPGAEQTPEVPVNVVATLVSPTSVAVKWPAAPRANHYRVWKKVNGVDQELVAVGSPTDTGFTIEGLPANSTIEIAVSAVNSGGESQISQIVTVVTH